MQGFLIILFIAAVVALAIYSYYQNQQRLAELRAWALREGLQYLSDQDGALEDRFAEFACLKQGNARYGYNLMQGTSSSRPTCAFDYHYETYSTDSKGNHETHHHYFSAVVVDSGLPLKPLLIRPENFFDKLTEFFGYDDIDFESDAFSRAFYVKSSDRRWAFDVIGQSTMEFLLAAPRFVIELAGQRVIAYRATTFAVRDFAAALEVIHGVLDRLPKSVLREVQREER